MKYRPSQRRSGFTLVELMVVVAVMAILAVVAVPMFGNMMNKSRDASTKGNLGSIRSAISIYSADNEGSLPSDHLQVLVEDKRYLKEIPRAYIRPHHDESSQVDNTDEQGGGIETADTGYWMYLDDQAFEVPGGRKRGEVWVGCTHLHTDGRPWTAH